MSDERAVLGLLGQSVTRQRATNRSSLLASSSVRQWWQLGYHFVTCTGTLRLSLGAQFLPHIYSNNKEVQ